MVDCSGITHKKLRHKSAPSYIISNSTFKTAAECVEAGMQKLLTPARKLLVSWSYLLNHSGERFLFLK